jgi:hypothetical protein
VGLFAAQCQYDAEPFLFESGASGTGTAGAHNADTRMVALVTTAGTGASWIQSYEYIPYQPGKSVLALITGLLGAGAAAAVVDVGLFDADNGFFLRQNGTNGLQLVRRSKTSGTAVNEVVDQADWNVDKLNGTGASGITLDPTKVFILAIDAQFLGMGRVRVYFDIGGQLVLAHQFLHANVIAVPYMQTLSLPIQMLVSTTSAAKTAYFKCASVSSEGGYSSDIGYTFSTPEMTVTAGSGTATHLTSLRPRSTFNSLTNRSRLSCSGVDIVVTGSNPILWELCLGSTFSAGPTFANVNTNYSGAEYASGVGTLTTVGLPIASGYIQATNQSKGTISHTVSQRYPLTLDRSGAVRANGTLSLIVTGIGGTSATRATLTYTEVR